MMTSAQRPGRLLCVGDIHGCASELEVLLADLELGATDRLVFLGDYVDRGPASREAIDLVLAQRTRWPETVLLRGNHEAMMLSFLGLGGEGGDVFLRAGGVATLASYGVDVRSRPPLPQEVLERVPPAHLELLCTGLQLHLDASPYLFVHAGVRPGRALEEQQPSDLLWIREEFLSAEHGLARTVVFGHTPFRDVWFGGGRIGLDTGCVYGGRLSCLDFTEGVLHQVKRGSRTPERRSVRRELGG